MTTALNIRHTLYRAPAAIADPGSGNTITIDRDGGVCTVTTAGAEARTLRQPTKEGITGTVVLGVWVGDLTLTVTGGFNIDGDTSITYDSAGDWVVFQSFKIGTSYYWRAVAQEGTTASIETSVIDNLQVDTKAIISNGAYAVIGHTAQEVVSNGDGATNMTPTLQVMGTTQDDSSAMLACFNTTNTVAPTLGFVKGGNAAIGSHTTVANDEYLGRIIAFADDSADLETPCAEVRFVVDGTPAADAVGGSIEFLTTPDGSSTLTGAVTINSAQNLVVLDGNGLQVGAAAQETISTGDGATDLIPEVQVQGTTQADSSAALMCFNATDTVAATLAFVKGGNAAIGTHTTVADNEYLGRIIAFSDDGADLETPSAEMRFVVDGTPAASQVGGSIEFLTTPDGSTTLTGAVTINSAQNLVVLDGNGLMVGAAAPETISNGDGSTALIPEVQVQGTTQADSSVALMCFNATDTIASTLAFVKGGNAAIGVHTTVADNECLGRVVAFADDGADLQTPCAEVRFVVDGTPAGNQVGGSMEFLTTPDGSSTLAHAMTITSGQVVVEGSGVPITTSDGDGTTNLLAGLQAVGVDTAFADGAVVVATCNTTNTRAVAPRLAFVKGAAATQVATTAVADNEVAGLIIAHVSDSADFETPIGSIEFVVDDVGAPGAGTCGGSIEFYTTADASEVLTHAMTITNAQVVVEGSGVPVQTSDGDGATNLTPGLQAVGVDTAFSEGALLVATCNTTNTRAVAPRIVLVKGAAATQVATTAVADNEVAGLIIAHVSDGADFETPVGSIEFVVDDVGAPGAGACGGSIEFYTTADGGEVLTKAMTISSAQQVTLDANTLATTAGGGITAGVGVGYGCSVEKVGTLYKTTIIIDVTGLNSGHADGDIIGVSPAAASCHIGQITASRNGTIFAGRMTCLEVPAGGSDDIDLWMATESTGAEDTAITALTDDAALVSAGGAWTLSLTKALTAYPTADKYLYLVGNSGDATYTAGIFEIVLWGK